MTGGRPRRSRRWLLPGLLLTALLAATVWGLMRRSPAAFAGAWFFLILAPTSSVFPIVTEVAAEHRMYLPLAGVIALAVLGLFGGVAGNTSPAARLAGAGLLAASAVVILFARMTYARNADYHGLRSHLVRDHRRAPAQRARPEQLRDLLLMKGRYAEAEPHLRVAVDGEPVARGGRSQSRRRAVGAGPARRRRRSPPARHRAPARLRVRSPQSRRNLRDAASFRRGARRIHEGAGDREVEG